IHVCFAFMGVPLAIKTDNGPAYASLQFKRFCNLWGITHDTSIAHDLTSQALVEWANQA
ncbi:POK6 protein, partial [Neodrepanis coruscans]|nr:POK6 protein [Neodrepanis coruscans]